MRILRTRTALQCNKFINNDIPYRIVGKGKGKTDSDKIEKNPFGDDSETVRNGTEGEGRFRDGNYSDCDNESDDEEDSDNEQNSSAGSPSVRVKKSIVDTAFEKKDDGDDSSDSEELTFKKR